jgi:hypothetical protein
VSTHNAGHDVRLNEESRGRLGTEVMRWGWECRTCGACGPAGGQRRTVARREADAHHEESRDLPGAD